MRLGKLRANRQRRSPPRGSSTAPSAPRTILGVETTDPRPPSSYRVVQLSDRVRAKIMESDGAGLLVVLVTVALMVLVHLARRIGGGAGEARPAKSKQAPFVLFSAPLCSDLTSNRRINKNESLQMQRRAASSSTNARRRRGRTSSRGLRRRRRQGRRTRPSTPIPGCSPP